MHKGSFFFGIVVIWIALAVGELYRIRIELPRRPVVELAIGSLMVGLTDLIATNPQQYIEIAVNLANDLNRLESLRSHLRQRMQSSPIMDAPAATRGVENAYRTIWSEWCSRGTMSKA